MFNVWNKDGNFLRNWLKDVVYVMSVVIVTSVIVMFVTVSVASLSKSQYVYKKLNEK